MSCVSVPSWEQQRHAMIDEQLRKRGIDDTRVLEAMRRAPREVFVPVSVREQSYDDRALTVGQGQTISQPFMVATMLQALELNGQEKVLEIGTGTGYQAALLSYLTRQVESIELIPELANQARENLAALELSHIHLHTTDGSQGLAAEAPFDVIIVAAGAPDVPAVLLTQLAEGGRLLIPIGDRKRQVLTLFKKHGSQIMRQSLGACAFVPLRGAYGWPEV